MKSVPLSELAATEHAVLYSNRMGRVWWQKDKLGSYYSAAGSVFTPTHLSA